MCFQAFDWCKRSNYWYNDCLPMYYLFIRTLDMKNEDWILLSGNNSLQYEGQSFSPECNPKYVCTLLFIYIIIRLHLLVLLRVSVLVFDDEQARLRGCMPLTLMSVLW